MRIKDKVMSGTIGGHRCPPQRRRRQAGMLAAVAAGLAVLAAACGGASPAGSSPSPHPPGYQQYHAYSQCIRSHGAPFWPEPSQVAGQGVWDLPYTYKITPRILAQEHGPGWQAALTACQKQAPTALPYTAAQVSALRSRLQKLAACMRGHGISHFPSPAAGAYGAGFTSPGPGVNPDSAQFLAAQRACWGYAPGS
jgi:hypothetical protein